MKKATAICIVFSLLVNMTSCYSGKSLSTEAGYGKYAGKKNVKVLYAKTKQGRVIEFNRKYPGILTHEAITGYPEKKIPLGKADSAIFASKKPGPVSIWENGINYKLVSQDTSGYICLEQKPIQIALTDLETIKLVKPAPVKTLILGVGLLGAAIGLIGIILSPIFLPSDFQLDL